MSLIQKYIFEKKPLYVVFVVYVVFVDLMKCYDTINHNTLWFKLFKMGVQGKFLRIVKYMYRKVISCVKSINSFFWLFRVCDWFASMRGYVTYYGFTFNWRPWIIFTGRCKLWSTYWRCSFDCIIICWWYGYFSKIARGVQAQLRYCRNRPNIWRKLKSFYILFGVYIWKTRCLCIYYFIPSFF